MFFKRRSEEERALSETTGGGFSRTKPTIGAQIREKVKARLKEQSEFKQELATAQRGAYKKEAIRQAKKRGRQQAKPSKPFGGLTLGGGLGGSGSYSNIQPKAVKRKKSNMEKMLGL